MVDNKVIDEIVLEYQTEAEGIQFAEFSTDFASVVDNVKQKISVLFAELRSKFSSKDLSSENVVEILNSFVTGVKDVLAEATKYVESIANDSRTIEIWNGVKAAYTKIADTVVGACTDAYNYAMSNQQFREVYEVVEKKGKEVLEIGKEQYQKFIHDPNVRKFVVGARNNLLQLKREFINKLSEKKD